MKMMGWDKIATTEDGIELWAKQVLGMNVWQTRHSDCGWKSGGYSNKVEAIVVGAVHECEGSDYSLDEQFGNPIAELKLVGKATAATSIVSKKSK